MKSSRCIKLIGEDGDEVGTPDRDPGRHGGEVTPDHRLRARLLENMVIQPRDNPTAK